MTSPSPDCAVCRAANYEITPEAEAVKVLTKTLLEEWQRKPSEAAAVFSAKQKVVIGTVLTQAGLGNHQARGGLPCNRMCPQTVTMCT